MERGRSLPPLGIAYWSELVQAEWNLRMRRPVDLPVPDDDTVDLELEVPLQNQPSFHGGARGREQSRPKKNEKFSTPESWMERTNQGSGTRSAGMLPREEEKEEWESKGWPEEHAFGRTKQTEGPQPGPMEEQRVEGTLQRASEKELFDKLKEENEKLQQELQFWKTHGRSRGDGMRARSRSPIPPPPPWLRSPPQRQVERRQFTEEHQKFAQFTTTSDGSGRHSSVAFGTLGWL